jgi:NitT/TauT family transport system ATP-binding protein
MNETTLLAIENISKVFHNSANPLVALHNVSFRLATGAFVSLLGPSGSGKSTLLRIIGGLLAADTGAVWLQGEPLSEPRTEVGFVFQKNNLMPWRTVLQNVLLPIEVQQGKIREADRRAAAELLQLVGLAGFGDAYPGQLSGGMNQRVALARVLIQRPKLLLMDEPFGALDALTRERLNLELLRLHALHGTTILMVTHDIAEAVFLSDRVLVLSERPGQIVADIAIDLPRPRQVTDQAGLRFGALTLEVRNHLGASNLSQISLQPN